MEMCFYVEENSFVFSMMEGELVVRLEEGGGFCWCSDLGCLVCCLAGLNGGSGVAEPWR